MNLQYITDQNGNKNAVLVAMSEWENIQSELKELTRLRDKSEFFDGLTEAFYEVNQILDGKKKPNSFDDLLDEL
ncbi:MAG: hypothetical protein B6D61_04870 [Bacteroidetes bacterium 4484_249]|nr:MAG: hypothetical protein B6D61_04870 [Bacteroidetes bacterium 4484_249]